jgi:2-polyprenyl-3-methyl-5-hydroxy-6-metoxy-1,4-benzoquinol methylase
MPIYNDYIKYALMQSRAKITGKDVLEIGPKGGDHTRIIDSLFPKSITCVELAEKRNLVSGWCKNIKAPFNVHYVDLLRWKTKDNYDLILFSGVLYHNIEQIRLIKKLRSLIKLDGAFILESATTRNNTLRNLNVIEVFWPDGYRNTKTVRFLPSKLACRSLLEISGFKIIETSDTNTAYVSPDRLSAICSTGVIIKTYPELSNEYVEADIDEEIK